MEEKKIDRELRKVKELVIEINESIQFQFKLIAESVGETNSECYETVCKTDEDIQTMQYNFLEISMWKIMKQQMVATDLRKSIVYVNIVQNLRVVSHAAFRLARYLNKYEGKIPKNIVEFVTKASNVLLTQLEDIKGALNSENHDEIKKSTEMKKYISAMSKNEIADIFDTALKTQKLLDIKILLRAYRQINAFYECSSQLLQIAQWIFYMFTGKMYNLVAE